MWCWTIDSRGPHVTRLKSSHHFLLTKSCWFMWIICFKETSNHLSKDHGVLYYEVSPVAIVWVADETWRIDWLGSIPSFLCYEKFYSFYVECRTLCMTMQCFLNGWWNIVIIYYCHVMILFTETCLIAYLAQVNSLFNVHWHTFFCSICHWQMRLSFSVSRHRTLMNIFDKVPSVDKEAFVAPSASVIGDVQIGRGSSIWYGCVLRGMLVFTLSR